jgi:cellulose synthase/poly-beta-1,6-N-acetylglucosamine synthase-like glycosyltransferase
MENLFWFLAVFLLLQGILGVVEGKRYLGYIRRHLGTPQTRWTPAASVFLPCKGLDEGLALNVEALLSQDYPEYEIIFVTALPDDEALPALKERVGRSSARRIKFVTAGTAEGRGEKVNNLIEAVNHAASESEVFVFTDSDCRPHQTWLRQLIAPLSEPSVGVSTGYRWYFPVRGNWGSVLRSAWNASIATVLGEHDRNFCWGGSMAIRRDAFERAGVLDCWKHSVSDDYSMAIAVRAAGFGIHYEPRCLIGSYGSIRLQEFFHWATRQIVLTRVYSPRLWNLAFIVQVPFVASWWWICGDCAIGIGRTVLESLHSYLFALGTHLILVSTVYILSVARGIYRLKAILLIRAHSRSEILRFTWAYVLLAPLVSTITAYTLFASLLTRCLEWRGVRYELISPQEVRVIRNG